MDSEKLRKEGNEKFKNGKFDEAIELYTRSLEVDPSSHLSLSNRSLSHLKLGSYDLALQDAGRCLEINAKWAKGYLRKAAALNLLKRHEEAKSVALGGFGYSETPQLSLELVREWMTAGKALTKPKYAQLLEKLSDGIPDFCEIFCDQYCEILLKAVVLRLSDADGMTHEQMVASINGAVSIANKVLEDFRQPSSTAFQEWSETAAVQFESYPPSEQERLRQIMHKRTTVLTKWLKDEIHPALKQVLNPVTLLAVTAILVRCNLLSQAYTGHDSVGFLGQACAHLFDSGCFSDPSCIAMHLAVLNMVLTVHRTKGVTPSDEEVQQCLGICHTMDTLLIKLPASHKNYELIKQHYQQAVKVAREICAKVVSGFAGSHDLKGSLSELERAFLEIDSNPNAAEELAVKYIVEIAEKTERSETSSVSHINFIDAENMLYITGIFAKLQQFETARKLFENGENMLLSLIATVLTKKTLSLDELPATITNGRQLALSGAIWLKDQFPVLAASTFIRWKSLFTEVRAILIQVGLRNAYRTAFLSLERHAAGESAHKKLQALDEFKAIEGEVVQKCILPVINILYKQSVEAVSGALVEGDIVLDYTFTIYNPEYRDPPQSQAFGMALQHGKEPLLFKVDHELVHNLLIQFPKAIYQSWLTKDDSLHPVAKELSEALFPPSVQQLLLKPEVRRLYLCPDVDLICFPIDQLRLTEDGDTSKALHERFSVTFLSSPRELLRKQAVAQLRAMLEAPQDTSGDASSSDRLVQQMFKSMSDTSDDPPNTTPSDQLVKQVDSLNISGEGDKPLTPASNSTRESPLGHQTEGSQDAFDCYMIANPDFKHQLQSEPESGIASSLNSLLCSLNTFFGQSTLAEDSIPELQQSQREAENVQLLLSTSSKLTVHKPIVRSEATLSFLLGLRSPYVLHCATHGYASKQVSTRYKGNFWTDNSSGILLAGAATFRDGKYGKMDPKAGTGHMNAIAACGMQLDNTRLVFISACNSSVGSRPTQEMPNSFTQAVRAAGADTVISTLWTVTDEATAEFVSYFYDRLVKKPQCRPSEAVSYAKQMMRSTGRSMFYWGPFVCNGLDIPLFPDSS